MTNGRDTELQFFSLFFLSSDTLHNIILFPVNAIVKAIRKMQNNKRKI